MPVTLPLAYFAHGSEKCRSIRLAAELIVARKARATISEGSLRMTVVFFYRDSCGDAGEGRRG